MNLEMLSEKMLRKKGGDVCWNDAWNVLSCIRDM